ncbi:SufE family protein [Amorphus coralli]|uniref:SufE family protein n=1 Tax=Amorphus coralli TaxID=340680 RepID=UPI0003730EEB|nr:SufE family protein [Amorphus coralli]
MTQAPQDIATIVEAFELIDDWEERYRYVIELGKDLPPFPEDARTEENKVRGCVSQVWLETAVSNEADGPHLSFQGDSDAHIVRGLVAILLSLYSGRTATQILATDAEATLGELGLREHLTPQRSNGLSAMVGRIRRDAEAALENA